MGATVDFDQPAEADLTVEAVYKGGMTGNAADDPLGRLLPCGNQLYTDERDVQRVYEMSMGDGAWRLWRDGQPFSQRFTGTFSEDGKATGPLELPVGAKLASGAKR